MKKLFLTVLMSVLVISTFAQQPLWMRYNRISPNGDKIAFTYKVISMSLMLMVVRLVS